MDLGNSSPPLQKHRILNEFRLADVITAKFHCLASIHGVHVCNRDAAFRDSPIRAACLDDLTRNDLITSPSVLPSQSDE